MENLLVMLRDHLLTVITFLPLLAMAVVVCVPSRWPRVIRAIAISASGVTLALTLYLSRAFQPSAAGFQFVEHAVWIRAFNVEYFLGVDGLSISLVLLTSLITFIAMIASLEITQKVKGYFAMLLLLQTGMTGTFLALDLILFYFFWEVMLLPMYFLIGVWGGPRREYAAIKFFLYTLFGSVLMLIGILALHLNSRPSTLIDGTTVAHTFNLVTLMAENDFSTAPLLLGLPFAPFVFVLFFIGFSIKIPMVPFHTWLPDAHVEAPTPISVVLAGVLLKMGVYGILRVNFGILAEAAKWAAPAIALFGTINIVYGALVCMAQTDFKKLIAYSSVSHMGFCLLGMSAFTDAGMAGCVLQLWNHGLISGMLFLLVGVIYSRAHHRDLNRFGGIAQVMPEYAALTGLAFMASLGLPGLAGFVSELLSFLGAFPVYKVLTVVSTSAIVVTAAYYLWTMQRVFLGPLNESYKGLPGLLWRERLTLYPLGALIIVMGVYPQLILNLIYPAMARLVQSLQ
jgi:NADH-quinone oxidoreductase subunit M